MTYPNNIDTFVTRIDKNASGWYISGESFNVPGSPYTLYLDHVPMNSSTTNIKPSGGGAYWVQDYTGTPAAGEFYVDYDVGKVTFNSADTATALEALYYTLGDDIMAEHINSLQASASGVEVELGLGCRGIYQNVSQRLDSFMTIGSAIAASQVSCISPGGTTFTDVQGHIDAAGGANVVDANPHGIGWDDIFDTDGDMERAQNNISINILRARQIAASGNILGMNVDGPDADQYIYFYNSGSPIAQWIKWDDGDDRFEVEGDFFVHGNINASGVVVNVAASGSTTSIQYNTNGCFDGDGELTWNGSILTTNNIEASGNIMPTASGAQDIGSAALSWDHGYFDNLEAANSLYAKDYYGDGSHLTGISTTTDFISLTDTPSSYFGMSASGVRVNPTETGLEFYDLEAYPELGAYVHYQTIAATDWIVNHNLGTDEVLVQCTDSSVPPRLIIPTEVEFTDNNTVTVNFPGAITGEVRIISASGAIGAGGGGAASFLELNDTPTTYSGMAASGVRVNLAADGLEFCDTGVTWDTPVNYNIIPDASGTIDIGSPTNTFNSIYTQTIYADEYYETSDTGIFYWGDPDTDGTWRITRLGDDLVVQRRESTSWVTKSIFIP